MKRILTILAIIITLGVKAQVNIDYLVYTTEQDVIVVVPDSVGVNTISLWLGNQHDTTKIILLPEEKEISLSVRDSCQAWVNADTTIQNKKIKYITYKETGYLIYIENEDRETLSTSLFGVSTGARILFAQFGNICRKYLNQ